MKQRRVSGFVLASLVLSLLVFTATPADAARMNLHKGSRGAKVRVLEARLANLYFLTPTAVDRRYRAATVNAVREFQWRIGLPVTGRVNKRTWNLVGGEARRRAAAPAPIVIGHRGQVAGNMPENTLGAMQYAAPHVGMLEFDVRMTADKELVLMHDLSLDRTTNCTGRVASWTAEDLREQCRAGSQLVPTFDEAVGFAASVGKTIAPDLKDVAMGPNELAKVADVIRSHGLASRAWVQSSYAGRFATLRQLEPRLRTVLVSQGAPAPGTVTGSGAAGIAMRVSMLTIPRVGAYRRAGLRVWGWTARSTAALELSKAMHVDAVVTDIPGSARSLYRR